MELLKHLTRDCAKALGDPAIIVSPQDSIHATIVRMRSEGHGCVLVASDGKLVGIFTERDILTRVLTKAVDQAGPISSVMTADPVTLGPDAPVAKVLKKMDEGGYRHLPIVQSDGTILGTVSVKALVNYLVEHFPESVFNLPPTPDQIQRAREGA